MDKWKYYGRTAGGPNVFEVFRFPDNGLGLDDQDWCSYPEWLQPDGSWACYADDTTISDERANGNFDEYIDEISKEQVETYLAAWSAEGWPGRSGRA